MGKQKHRPGEKRKPFSMPKGGSYRALLAMDFASGRMAYRHSKFKKETRNNCFTFFPLEHDLTKWESAFTDGRAKVFVAGDLSEANVAALTDVSYPVPVETMAEWYEATVEAVNDLVAPPTGNNSLINYRAMLQGRNRNRVQQNLPAAKLGAGIHWLFMDGLPRSYTIVTYGEVFTKQPKIPLGLDLVGVKATQRDTLTVTVDPLDIQWLQDQVQTAWASSNDMKVTWNIKIPGSAMSQIFFRFRLQAAGHDPDQQRLRMEMLVLPPGTAISAFSGAALENLNGPNTPAIEVFVKHSPVVWATDGNQHLHHHFTSPNIVYINNGDQPSGALDQIFNDDTGKPQLNDKMLRRLLWETAHKFTAGSTAKRAHEAQKAFIQELKKDPNTSIKYNTPVLRLAGLSPKPKGKDTEARYFYGPQSPSVASSRVGGSQGGNGSGRDSGSNASSNSNTTARGGKNGPEPSQSQNKASSDSSVAPVPSDSEEDDGSGHLGERNNKPFVVYHNGRVNKDRKRKLKGKGLLKYSLLSGSRYTDEVPVQPATLSSLAVSYPRADVSDLYHIHATMASSLAKSSKSNVNSAIRAFSRVMGSDAWLQSPMQGDREVILSRLLRFTSISRSTALQYLKCYKAALSLSGKEPPPESEAFRRMKRGVKKGMIAPIKDAAEDHRQAYSLASLEMAITAFKLMFLERKWSFTKFLMFKTILLLAFWGRFRLGELTVPAQNNIKIEDTVLRLDVDLIGEEHQEQFLRVWLRKEKAAAHRAGSLVEIPKLPANLKKLCPFRTMTRYLQRMDKAGMSRFDPLFTDLSGSAMTPGKFSAGVKDAIRTTMPNIGQELFKTLKNHSCRSAIPTICQELECFIDKDILKSLGRWESDAYLQYLKSYQGALKTRRFVEEEIIKKISEAKKQDAVFFRQT